MSRSQGARRRVVRGALLVLALGLHAQGSFAEGNADAGARVFRQSCQACHTLAEGDRHRAGPNLFGLFGATAGQRAFSFKRHSPALKQSGVVWSEQTLDRFLENPKEFIPGSRMPFIGLARRRDRADVIAFLKATTR